MDLCETLAREHLLARFPGEGRVEYEPRGRYTTPDFGVDGRIAVEVSLLSEHDGGDSARPLMETATPFMNDFRTFANSLCSQPERSLFVYVDYSRPIPSRAEIRRDTKAFLQDLLAAKNPVGTSKRFGPHLSMKCLREMPVDDNRAFVFAWVDGNSGGTPLELMKRNIRLCIQRKSATTAAHRSAFEEWWLVLVDYVSFTSDYEIDGICASLGLEHDFDKVLGRPPILGPL